jgi:hypothetical protein
MLFSAEASPFDLFTNIITQVSVQLKCADPKLSHYGQMHAAGQLGRTQT